MTTHLTSVPLEPHAELSARDVRLLHDVLTDVLAGGGDVHAVARRAEEALGLGLGVSTERPAGTAPTRPVRSGGQVVAWLSGPAASVRGLGAKVLDAAILGALATATHRERRGAA